MNTKRMLIPWSAGFDSTALIVSAFSNNIPFDTCYVRVSNNEHITKEELKARTKILKKLNKMYSHNSHIEDIIFDSITIKNNDSLRLTLPFIWLNSILINLNLKKYSKISFGYVKYDDFWHIKHEFLEMYKYGHYITRLNNDSPQITFPFEWLTKQIIFDRYYKKHDLKILKHIWYCEKPINSKACNNCDSCKRHNNEVL